MAVIPAPARARPLERAEAAERRPRLSSRQLRILTPVLLATVVVLPLHVPRYPYNLVPADMPLLLFILLAAAAFWRSRVRLQLPLAFGYILVLVGGAVAITQSIVPGESARTLIQDAYLFAWFLLVVNLIARAPERLIRRAAVAWAIIGAAIGALMWSITIPCPENIPVILGHRTATAFCRVSGTFFDENLAGYYLVTSLFVAWAAPWPRGKFGKVVVSVPIVLGIYATESITALIVTAAAVVTTAAVTFVSRRQAAAAATLLILALGISVVAALPPDFQQESPQVLESLGGSATFEGSLGRSERSIDLRARRWEEALHYFGGNMLVGIGPAATDDALLAEGALLVNELHNDYLAGFLERGITGGVGVLLVFGAASAWAMRVSVDRRLRRTGWHPAAFAGAMVAALLTSISLETLHFRHQWLVFAFIIGLGLRRELGTDAPESHFPQPRPSQTLDEGGPDGAGDPASGNSAGADTFPASSTATTR